MTTKRTIFIDDAVEETEERLEFYDRIGSKSLAPLWKQLAALVTKEPQPRAAPYIWRYTEMLPMLMESIGIIDAEEAERRVLVLENPALKGEAKVLDSLYSGLQIIAPGECAPAHRHQASALRFLVDGTSAYTAVNGEKTIMAPGDFVITPSWAWHDHACVGDHPAVWMDVLDLHITNMLSGSFREESLEMQQEYPRPNDSSILEFSSGVVPANHQPEHRSSPVVNYRYSTVKNVLASMQSHRDIDEHFGYLVKYTDPTTGDWAIPTIASHMRMLPAGFETTPYQSTDGTVFSVVEGRGESLIGDQVIQWERGDVFVAPQWAKQVHRATTDSVIFSASDRAAQEKLHLWRELRH